MCFNNDYLSTNITRKVSKYTSDLKAVPGKLKMKGQGLRSRNSRLERSK